MLQISDASLSDVRIVGRSTRRIHEVTRKAEEEVRALEAAAQPSRYEGPEPAILAATRRALVKGRPDSQGFVTVRGRGIVPAKLSPASIERALRVLSQLLGLAERLGHRPVATDVGLALQIDDEAVDFGLEEPSTKNLHVPTPSELRAKADHERWRTGSLTPWPKYDHAPSGRLSFVIHSNPYRGLRKTFSDHR